MAGKDLATQFKAKLAPALKSDSAQRELNGFIKKRIQDQRAFLDCLWQFAMGFSTEWEGVEKDRKHRGLSILYALLVQAIELAAPTNELADFVLYIAASANEARGGKADKRQFRLPQGEMPEQYPVYASRWSQLPPDEQRELQARAQKKRQQALDRRTLITYVMTAYRKANPEAQKPTIEDLYGFDPAPNTRRQELDIVMQECDSAWRRFSRAGKVPEPPNEKNLDQLDRAFRSLRQLLLDTGANNMPGAYQLWKWIRDGRTRKVQRGYSWGEQYTETVQPILSTVWIEMYLDACYCAIRLAMGKWAMWDVQRANGFSADDRDFILQAVSEDERANFVTRLSWGVKNTLEFEELNRIRRRMNRFGEASGMNHLDEFQTTALANEIARIQKTNPSAIEAMVVQAASQWVAFRDKFRIGQTVLDSFSIVWSMDTPAGPRVIVELVKFPWQPFAVSNDRLGDLVRDAVWRKMQELGNQIIAFLLAYLEVVGMVVDVITAGASGGLRHVAFEFAKERLKDKLTDEVLDAFHVENAALRTVAGFAPNLVPRGKVKVHVEPDVGGDLARTQARAVASGADVTKAEAKAIANTDVHARGVDGGAAPVDARTTTGVDRSGATAVDARAVKPADKPWVAPSTFGTDPGRPGWTHQKVQQQQTKVEAPPAKEATDPKATDVKATGAKATAAGQADAPKLSAKAGKGQPAADLQDPHGNLTPEGADWIKRNRDTVYDSTHEMHVDPKTLSHEELNKIYRKNSDLIERVVIAEIKGTWAGRPVKPTDFLYAKPRGTLDEFADQLERSAKAAGIPLDRSVLQKNAHDYIMSNPQLRAAWEQANREIVEELEKLRKNRMARGTRAGRGKESDWEGALEKQQDEIRKLESGRIGRKQPDAVEVLLGQGEVFVWDATQRMTEAFHNFKTTLYSHVVNDMLGGKVRVKPADYRAAQLQRELW